MPPNHAKNPPNIQSEAEGQEVEALSKPIVAPDGVGKAQHSYFGSRNLGCFYVAIHININLIQHGFHR